MSSRNASILRNLSAVSGGTPFAFDNHSEGVELHSYANSEPACPADD
jgi:hypothetical protein